jgi:hypothetical protein
MLWVLQKKHPGCITNELAFITENPLFMQKIRLNPAMESEDSSLCSIYPNLNS